MTIKEIELRQEFADLAEDIVANFDFENDGKSQLKEIRKDVKNLLEILNKLIDITEE